MGAFQYGRRNKYRAVRTDGFASKLEAAVYYILLQREKSGEISEIQRQASVELVPGPPKIRVNWKIDFSFVDNKTKETVYCEAKGLECGIFKLKLRIFIAKKIGKLEIWKGSHKSPKLYRVIDPDEF